ncbi:hypothetical protein ACMX2M_17035 [Paenibacillus polymyxa]
MNKKSPMLIHSIESFQHGIEHFFDGTPLGRKFAILHIDHAIELLLKERVVLLGKSIYRADGLTLSVHETLNSLKEVSIPEKPRLQEIHDLRNTIQHKGITPDEFTTDFYIEVAYEFFKRFSVEEMGLQVDEIIASRFIRLFDRKYVIPDQKFVPSIDFNHDASPTENIINGYAVLEKHLKDWQDRNPDLKTLRGTIYNLIEENGYDKDQVKQDLASIFGLRGRVVKSEYEPTYEELVGYLNNINGILLMMNVSKDKI